MQLRWEWLAPQITVPYVPALGPVHPDVVSAEMFDAVVEAGRSGELLPYDKERRWGIGKAERLLPDPLLHTSTDTVLATSTTGLWPRVTAYHYGAGLSPADVAALARDFARDRAAPDVRSVWFQLEPPEPGSIRVVNVLLKDFAEHRTTAHREVVNLAECAPHVRASLAELAHEPENAGFAFLAERFANDELGGPVLAVVEQDRVAGAIGPMELLPDATGRPTLLPQYFGVAADFRGKGFGRDLWRAAMDWGFRHGAAYQLLQTEVGGASGRLCLSEGLRSLGYVCST